MTPSPAHSPAPAADKRTQALLLAHEKLVKYCKQLYSPREILYKAEAIYKQAYDANLKRKDSLRAFLAACIFLAYRQENMFLDIHFMFGRIDASVTKTIEALWYLELFVDGAEVQQGKITVTSETSNGRFHTYISGQPSVGMFNFGVFSSPSVRFPEFWSMMLEQMEGLRSQDMSQLSEKS